MAVDRRTGIRAELQVAEEVLGVCIYPLMMNDLGGMRAAFPASAHGNDVGVSFDAWHGSYYRMVNIDIRQKILELSIKRKKIMKSPQLR